MVEHLVFATKSGVANAMFQVLAKVWCDGLYCTLLPSHYTTLSTVSTASVLCFSHDNAFRHISLLTVHFTLKFKDILTLYVCEYWQTCIYFLNKKNHTSLQFSPAYLITLQTTLTFVLLDFSKVLNWNQ